MQSFHAVIKSSCFQALLICCSLSYWWLRNIKTRPSLAGSYFRALSGAFILDHRFDNFVFVHNILEQWQQPPPPPPPPITTTTTTHTFTHISYPIVALRFFWFLSTLGLVHHQRMHFCENSSVFFSGTCSPEHLQQLAVNFYWRLGWGKEQNFLDKILNENFEQRGNVL